MNSVTHVRLAHPATPLHIHVAPESAAVAVTEDAEPIARPRWTVALMALFGSLAIATLLTVAAVAMGGCSASQQRTETAVTIVGAGAGVQALQLANHAAYRAITGPLHAAGIVGAAYAEQTRAVDAEFNLRGDAIQLLARLLDLAARHIDDPNAPLDPARTLELVEGALVILAHGGGIMAPLAIPPEITTAVAALRIVATGAQ